MERPLNLLRKRVAYWYHPLWLQVSNRQFQLVMLSLLKVLLSAVWLFLTFGVLINLWRDQGSSNLHKVWWSLGILLFPILGPVLFLLFGTRNA